MLLRLEKHIGYRHSLQYTTVCVFKRRVKKRSDDYLCQISVIYDWPFQAEMGNTTKHQTHCIQRKNGKHQHRDRETGRTA